MTLLDRPHHDGSPLYLADEAPELGTTVTVRVRTSAADPVSRMWVRTTYDAEPTYHEMTGSHGWWEGELPVHNPVTHYRFLIEREDATQTWLTGVGEQHWDVSDAFDFKVVTYPPAPDWARDGVVYQIFPDRFARSAAADGRQTPAWATKAGWDDTVVFESTDLRTPTQLFGGDLDGIVDHLDHIARAGADIVYTTPVFPGESNHRYNASTFDHVDPLLGGDAAYERLSEAVHERGWRLLGDLTANHTGDTHEWFRQARQGGATRDWYYFRPDGGYETWMGHHTLPKLNHADDDLRHAMVEGPDSVVARWLRRPYDVDGWRIDVANMTGRLGAIDVNHNVARTLRETAAAQREDPLVIGEHNHDAARDIDGDGWHGTMNYSGFSWPVWSWLRAEETDARPFGRPVGVPSRPGDLIKKSLDGWRGRFGWRATAQSWNILSSHDSARIRTMVRDPARHRVAAGLQFTLPGVPMLFAGDEIGLEGVNGEDGRRPMPWGHPEGWDHATLATYAALSTLRRNHIALRRGGLRWAHVGDDELVFLREHPGETVLVAARRAPGAAIALDLPAGTALLGHDAFAGSLPATDTPAIQLWRLASA